MSDMAALLLMSAADCEVASYGGAFGSFGDGKCAWANPAGSSLFQRTLPDAHPASSSFRKLWKGSFGNLAPADVPLWLRKIKRRPSRLPKRLRLLEMQSLGKSGSKKRL